jgi:hypothetical protein
MTRDDLAGIIDRCLAEVGEASSRGVLTLAVIQRNRRRILWACDNWHLTPRPAELPPAPPGPTQTWQAAQHRDHLARSLAGILVDPKHRSERPSR